MRRIRELLTPENVFIEYELAGLGSRMIAFAVDTLIQIFSIMVIWVGVILSGVTAYTMNSFSSVLIAVGVILIFVIYFGYFIFFEMLMEGQTPGKRIAKIKVIKQNGEPIGFFESLIRNILRLIDIIVSFCILGAVFILFSKDFKRVGDFASNTIVVKLKNTKEIQTAEELFGNAVYKEDKAVKEPCIYPVSEFEYGVLKEFMDRRLKLGARGNVFAFRLNRYFSQKFGTANKYPNPYNFFEDIIKMNKDT